MTGLLNSQGIHCSQVRIGAALKRIAPEHHARRQANVHRQTNPVPYVTCKLLQWEATYRSERKTGSLWSHSCLCCRWLQWVKLLVLPSWHVRTMPWFTNTKSWLKGLYLHACMLSKPDPLMQKVRCIQAMSNHIAVSCHMMHYSTVWVAITVCKTVTERARTSFVLLQSCKNTSTILLRVCTLRNRYFKSALFEIWFRHLANCIPVGHGLHTQSTRPFPICRSGLACETTCMHTVGWDS